MLWEISTRGLSLFFSLERIISFLAVLGLLGLEYFGMVGRLFLIVVIGFSASKCCKDFLL
jgi:hypothetical protein